MDEFESVRVEASGQFGADFVGQNGAAYVDGVAGKAEGVGFADGDAFVLGIAGLDLGERLGVESGGKIQEMTSGQGAETGVEVVEPRVHEVE